MQTKMFTTQEGDNAKINPFFNPMNLWNSFSEYKEIENAIEAFSRGEFLVVSDNESRENEGDLIIAADKITPEALNFMITEGRGLVCVTIVEETAKKFGLRSMVECNTDHNQTAFTISIDAKLDYGVKTGISAFERAKTIQLLADPDSPKDCMQSPGHIFPLIAKPGGVLERDGHTEAGVDLARLAGLNPAAVIVEIIHKNGTMAQRADLEIFSKKHGLHYITIDNLKKYIQTKQSQSKLNRN